MLEPAVALSGELAAGASLIGDARVSTRERDRTRQQALSG